MPDIEAWARVAAQFVRPGGTLYVTEIHPVANVFADDGVAPGELRLAYPYWSHAQPLTFDVRGSYADPSAATEGLVEHGWDHSLGEIVTRSSSRAADRVPARAPVRGVAGAVPRRRRRRAVSLPPDAGGELPLFFSLRATKPPADAPDAAGAHADAAAVRRRAADELHDAAGQSLVAASRFLDAALARGVAAGGAADPDVQAAHAQVVAAMRELRAVVDTLAPPGLEERGLSAAIREWAERQGQVGVEIAVHGELPAGEAALDIGWFDLVTAAAGLGRRRGTAVPIAIELHDTGDRRIITVAGAEGGPGLAPVRDEDGCRPWRGCVGSLHGSAGRCGSTSKGPSRRRS